MRALIALALFASPLSAETLSEELGRTGLGATESRLAALASPSDADRFALGGVRFLSAVEHTMQLRWASGFTDRSGMLPMLNTRLPENPTPAPFDPALFTSLFTDITTTMDAARAPLAEIPDTSDFGVEIKFADLWFDINANHTRDPGEDMLDVLGPLLLGWQWQSRDPNSPAPTVRFDVADAAWLSAYSHLLAGMSDMILAYDPTPAVTKIMQGRAKMESLGTMAPDPIFGMDATAPDGFDVFATVFDMLHQTPDVPRMAAARDHLLAMVADNRRFWTLVDAETDNQNEWLPNARQKSSLGLDLPPETAANWLAVLSDLEAMLNGEKLVPYWRLEGPVGVNIKRVFLEPAPIDVVGWIHGWAAAPYLENGDLISPDSLNRFEGMMQGQGMLMAFYLN